ncbi:MAG: DNA mismatch repair endonuclease MutL, partial [Clostridia bacterium]|nr:DNA mismatch repair endonuclease MutL [Clostridia bacterium]
MSKINVLPKNIADLIAAGEVVDRPASIVKETVENSIDAGASFITVEIKNGGISYIRVTDNGSGIEKDDVKNAFVSHATSKVLSAEDLDSIMTLGFRGEALASIAAVAKIELMTRTATDEVGTRYVVEASEEKSFDDAGCPIGTTIVIRDLFFNTPARMKFLKKDVTEANAVSAVMDRMALSHPEISFRFIRDGKETLLTHGDGKLISSIYSVFSKDFASALVPVDYELNGVKVTGFISKPLNSRPNRSMQFFFVNNRYVKSKTAFIALEEAYKNQIMVGKFPACVLNISIPFDTVDVNVHPSKLEVRFSNEKLIFNAVYYGCINSLRENDTRPVVNLDTIASKPDFRAPVEPKYEQTVISAKPSVQPINRDDFWQKVDSSHFSGFVKDDRSVFSTNFKMASQEESSVTNYYNDNNSETDEKIEETDSTPQKQYDVNEPSPQTAFRKVKIVGEAFKTYIFAEADGKLYIVDKHAAHERILFEIIKRNASLSERQILLSPVSVTLEKNEYDSVIENADVLLKSGFLVEEFGIGTVVVRECPLTVSREEIPSLVGEIAGYLVENKTDVVTDKLDWIFHSSACRAAIKAGDATSEYEMEKLVEQIFDNDDK